MMPNLDKGTKCVKILPSKVSKYTYNPLFLMLFPILEANWLQNEKPLSRSIMVGYLPIMAGYLQIMAGYLPIMVGYCPVKDKTVLILIGVKGQTCKKHEAHQRLVVE